MSKKTTTLKIESFGKLQIAKGSINGDEAYFIIDSSSSITVFNENDANFYDFNIEEDETSEAFEYEGNSSCQRAIDLVLRIGGIELWMPDFKAQDLSRTVNAIKLSGGPKINGILGIDLLQKYEFVVNLKDRNFSFTH